MNQINQLIFSDKEYKIISAEQEFIIHPAALGLIPLTKASSQQPFSVALHIKDYQLMLDRLTVQETDNSEKQYDFEQFKVSYNGAILIGTNQVKEYCIKNSKPACFSYQTVKELIFEDGMLITAVDQDKAMLRIRKNLELGLRSLTVSRDIRCIRRFMNSAFVGDYKPFKLVVGCMKYLKDMQKYYEKENILIKT